MDVIDRKPISMLNLGVVNRKCNQLNSLVTYLTLNLLNVRYNHKQRFVVTSLCQLNCC